MYVVLDRQQRQSEPGVGENETERNEVGGMRSEYAGDPTGDDLIHTVEVLDIHDRRDEDARYPRSEASVTWIKDCVRIVRDIKLFEHLLPILLRKKMVLFYPWKYDPVVCPYSLDCILVHPDLFVQYLILGIQLPKLSSQRRWHIHQRKSELPADRRHPQRFRHISRIPLARLVPQNP